MQYCSNEVIQYCSLEVFQQFIIAVLQLCSIAVLRESKCVLPKYLLVLFQIDWSEFQAPLVRVKRTPLPSSFSGEEVLEHEQMDQEADKEQKGQEKEQKKEGRGSRSSRYSTDSYSYKFGRRLVDNLLPRKVGSSSFKDIDFYQSYFKNSGRKFMSTLIISNNKKPTTPPPPPPPPPFCSPLPLSLVQASLLSTLPVHPLIILAELPILLFIPPHLFVPAL